VSKSSAIVRALVSSLAMAFLIVVVLAPQVSLSPLDGLVFIVVLELVASILGWALVKGSIGQALIRTLILAALVAGAIVFFFQPTLQLGFDKTFLLVTFVEFIGVLVTWGLVHERPKK
jgi:hypothetical protein